MRLARGYRLVGFAPLRAGASPAAVPPMIDVALSHFEVTRIHMDHEIGGAAIAATAAQHYLRTHRGRSNQRPNHGPQPEWVDARSSRTMSGSKTGAALGAGRSATCGISNLHLT
jgi:hypothetical protein